MVSLALVRSQVLAEQMSQANAAVVIDSDAPLVAAASSTFYRELTDAELQRLVSSMREDLHGILDFIAQQGMVLEDHYRNVRALVDDVACGNKAAGPDGYRL